MTVTDELRFLLDERGVEYRFNDATKVFEWHFDGTDGEGSAHATEVNGGINIIACSLTPEQAIAATLGAGTCQMEYVERPTKSTLDAMGVYFCSECGSPTYNDCMPRYCIYCGAEVSA